MRRPELLMVGAVAAAVMALLLVDPAMAKSSIGIGSAEVTAQPSGPLAGLFIEIAVYQRQFFTALRHALVGLKSSPAATPLLVGLSFAYGIFHAAGPGHGKAVISAYILANEVQLRRGILLSFVSALLQALTALIVVGAGWFVLRGTTVTMTQATDLLELASYAAIAAFGGWLLVRKLVRLVRAMRPAYGLQFAMAGEASGYGTSGASFGASAPRSTMPRASGPLAADICTDDEADCDCGRAHMPSPQALGGQRLRFGPAASAVVAVGLRPCSGAIVVLTFALANGLYAGGILSVLAMAIGTAVTVSAIAAVAVFAKGWALRLGQRGSGAAMLGTILEIAGAALLLVIGLLMLGAALQPV
ncbi:nickel/cobalt transporter [Mangrovicella endophytica]|uniref:nickel/cobalt transporter n=1 Tax=Mangrovicella endophytica TaxID=2066697 RepID=UPI001FDF7B75|nr:nickel/cobalt transporter [Mangrovicella endophytica]